DNDQHRSDQVQVLRLQANEVTVQSQGNEEAVDHRAEAYGQCQVEDPSGRDDAFADDYRGQADDDGADAHGDIRAALGLHEHGASQADQRVGNGHAQNHHGAGIYALRAGHARVGAGSANGQALASGKVHIKEDLGGDDHHQQDQRACDIVGQPLWLQGAEPGRFHDQRNIGSAHDAQVDRVQRNHHQDAGQQIHESQVHVEYRGDHAGQRTSCGGDQCGQEGVGAIGDEYGTNGAAQREAAVDGQVGEAQQAKGDKYAKRDQTEDQANLKGAKQGKQ